MTKTRTVCFCQLPPPPPLFLSYMAMFSLAGCWCSMCWWDHLIWTNNWCNSVKFSGSERQLYVEGFKYLRKRRRDKVWLMVVTTCGVMPHLPQTFASNTQRERQLDIYPFNDCWCLAWWWLIAIHFIPLRFDYNISFSVFSFSLLKCTQVSFKLYFERINLYRLISLSSYTF